MERGCPSRLQVQLFRFEGARYLTLRINREVPVRFALKEPGDLEPRLVEAMRRVLGHDPVYLAQDIRQLSAMQRAARSVLRRGRNTWRFELFQLVNRSGAGAALATGGAFSVSRGSERWYLFARLYAGGSLDGGGASRSLRVLAGGDLGLAFEFLRRAVHSPYLSAGFGVQLLHFEGRLKQTDRELESATDVGAAFCLRAGGRLFRASNFELDLFVAGYLPLFVTRDVDSPLMDDYTPSGLLGLGVGF